MKTHPGRIHAPARLLAVVLAFAGAAEVRSEAIDEILVTATRREQTTQEVPYNISALSGEELRAAGVTNLADLTRVIPGIAYADLGVRSAGVNNQLILRGLNSNAQGSINAYVETLTPAGVSTYMDNTPLFTNLKINDLERVEVLRGPQGTLYGAGSVGGTLRFIFNKPDVEEFQARVGTRIGFTEDADDVNYSADGVVNVPLSDSVAVRVAAGYENIAGFVDGRSLAVGGPDNPRIANPADPFGSPLATAPVEDVDDADQWYVRTSLLWKVSDRFQLQVTHHHQEDNADGLSVETNASVPGAKDRTFDQFFASPLEREVDLVSLELDIDLGFARLESSSSYTDKRALNAGDLTGLVLVNDIFSGGFAFGGYPATNGRLAGYFVTDFDEESFAQEVRLVSTTDSRWQWVVGVYHQEIDRDVSETLRVPGFAEYANTPGHPYTQFLPVPPFLSWADLVAGPPGFVTQAAIDAEVAVANARQLEIRDTAIFGELTWHATDAWQVTFGARAFWNKNRSSLVSTFPLFGAIAAADGMDPSGLNTAKGKESIQDEIFKVNTSYKFSDTLMAYFTWAEGFRRGGANSFPLTGFNSEHPSMLTFRPDTVTNYEFGIKGELFDRLDFVAAVYRIDWDDPQVAGTFLPSGFPAVINAEEARTQGVELQAWLQVSDHLRVSAGYSYTDAEFTEDFAIPLGPSDVAPDFEGTAGSRLPGVPESMASWTFDYVRPTNLFGPSEVHLRVDGFYRSSVVTAASQVSPQYTRLGGFDIWNASLTWSNDHWQVGAFVQNIGDEDGITAVVRDFAIARPEENISFLTRPRTIGLMLGYTY